jgi:hypothetical protein
MARVGALDSRRARIVQGLPRETNQTSTMRHRARIDLACNRTPRKTRALISYKCGFGRSRDSMSEAHPAVL